MDEQQQQAFAEAVERKKAEAKARSEQPGPGAPGGGRVPDASTPEQTDASRPQDAASIRDKNSRHKHVTADKWNQ